MTLRVRLKSTCFGQGPDSMRPWYAGLLSLTFHAAALPLVVVIVHQIPVARTPWFDHATVQYMNLSSVPSGAVYYLPPALNAASTSDAAATLPEPPKPTLKAPVVPTRGSRKPAVLPPPDPFPRPGPALPANLTALTGLFSPLSGPRLTESPAHPNEIRLLHPENAHFDVVLVQGGAPEEAAELPQFRNGPVYTAYLNVGTRKQWVLHYCSNDPEIQISDYEVRIGAIQPLEAPYPRVTVVPEDLPDAGDRITFSGLLDAEGKLRQVRPLGSSDPQYCGRVIPLLEKWLFRPAKKAGTPSDVAVVLVIPPK